MPLAAKGGSRRVDRRPIPAADTGFCRFARALTCRSQRDKQTIGPRREAPSNGPEGRLGARSAGLRRKGAPTIPAGSRTGSLERVPKSGHMQMMEWIEAHPVLARGSRPGRMAPLPSMTDAPADGMVMQDSFDITTLVFLGLAVFVIWRLRSVLGQKTGAERSPFKPVERTRSEPSAGRGDGDNVVRLPGADRVPPADADAPPREPSWQGIAEPGTPVARGLEQALQIEPAFDPRQFLEGAKTAYEAIVVAFAKGDRKTLRALLSREVGEGFERAIGERERNQQTMETTFVSIDKAEIVAVDVRNRVAQITVRFLSNLITATRDAQGKVVDGSAETVVEVPDVWTFARTLGTRDPNWQLVATEAGV